MLTWHCDRVCFIHFSTSELSFSTDFMCLGFPNLLLAHVNLQDFIHSYEHKRKLLCSLCSFYFVNTVSLFFSVEMSKFLTIWWATTSWALQITFILQWFGVKSCHLGLPTFSVSILGARQHKAQFDSWTVVFPLINFNKCSSLLPGIKTFNQTGKIALLKFQC